MMTPHQRLLLASGLDKIASKHVDEANRWARVNDETTAIVIDNREAARVISARAEDLRRCGRRGCARDDTHEHESVTISAELPRARTFYEHRAEVVLTYKHRVAEATKLWFKAKFPDEAPVTAEDVHTVNTAGQEWFAGFTREALEAYDTKIEEGGPIEALLRLLAQVEKVCP